MLVYLLIRVFKYIIADTALVIRYSTYAYWIPQMLMPALFLMTCIRIRRGNTEVRSRDERLLLIPGALLSLLVITNDLHGLVYKPRVDLSIFEVSTGTYSWGPGFLPAVCLDRGGHAFRADPAAPGNGTALRRDDLPAGGYGGAVVRTDPAEPAGAG